jgi:hypothetical protein
MHPRNHRAICLRGSDQLAGALFPTPNIRSNCHRAVIKHTRNFDVAAIASCGIKSKPSALPVFLGDTEPLDNL